MITYVEIIKMDYAVVLSKPPKMLLTELVNFETGNSFSGDELVFSNMLNHPTGKTEITVVVNGINKLRINYNRISLNKIFCLVDIELPSVNATEVELLNAISIKYNINLPRTDFYIELKNGFLYLIAKKTSAVYFGEYPILEVLPEEPEAPIRIISGTASKNISLGSISHQPIYIETSASAKYKVS